jgi:hypothetical protein
MGNTYEIQWADVATKSGHLFVQMEDERKLSEIAAEFENLDWLKREDANQGDKLFEGYSVLKIIRQVEPGVVILTFEKAGDN